MHLTLTLVIFLKLLLKCSGQVNNLPYIPCPEIFQYSFDIKWKAEIILPAPDVYDVHLIVNLTVPERDLQDDGELILTNKNIIDDIKNNRSFVYTYVLPESRNLPHLTEITYNGNIVCIGPEINKQPNYKFSKSHKINWFSPDIKLVPRPKKVNRKDSILIKPPNDNNCGLSRSRRQIVQLIYGGNFIPKGDHPWLAALYDTSSGTLAFFCGGNLISNRHILTAAHCMQKKKNVEVKLGSHNTTDFFENGAIVRTVAKYVNHEAYRPGNGHADLSILTLTEIVDFTEFVKPICLWSSEIDVDRIIGERGTIMGWGLTESGNTSITPLKTEVTIISQQQCEDISILKPALSNSTFCAGAKGAGPCLGDSGGGLFLRRQRKWYIRGIISLTSGNLKQNKCDLDTYGVYADTAKHIFWIIQNME